MRLCLSPEALWKIVPLSPAPPRMMFGSLFAVLLPEPFLGQLGTQNIGQDAPGAYLRSRFDGSDLWSNSCFRGGLAVLDKIAPAYGGQGVGLTPYGRRLTLRAMALRCRKILGRAQSSTLYFDRKCRPCRSMAHWMYS